MRKAPEGAPPLPEGWENLPEEYDIKWYEAAHQYSSFLKEEIESWNDQPAEVVYFFNGQMNYQAWVKKGESHREHGKPAIVYYNLESGSIYAYSYWLNDIEYFPDQTEVNTRILREIL